MAEVPSIEIPNRPFFKAAEVCELVKVQPYVLRSWENEFPELGASKAAGGPRLYKRADVEQVLRIKHLLLVEGLTLAGARRRLEEAAAPQLPLDAPAPAPPPAAMAPVASHARVSNGAQAPPSNDAREKLSKVKRGLRSILDLLADSGAPADNVLALETPESGDATSAIETTSREVVSEVEGESWSADAADAADTTAELSEPAALSAARAGASRSPRPKGTTANRSGARKRSA